MDTISLHTGEQNHAIDNNQVENLPDAVCDKEEEKLDEIIEQPVNEIREIKIVPICEVDQNRESIDISEQIKYDSEEVNRESKDITILNSVDSDNMNSDDSRNKISEIPKDIKEKLSEYPEVLKFIYRLQGYIEKQKKKIKKLKTKVKKKVKLKNVGTQFDAENLTKFETKDVKPKTLSEEITEAAEQAMQNTGFVYEETSGMYYDYNTGYYYNAEYGLFYEAKTGTYMKYNAETQTYDFHSQVALPSTENESSQKTKTKSHKSKRKKTKEDKEQARKRVRLSPSSKSEATDDLEEGECSDASIVGSLAESSSSSDNDSEECAKQWPPCMRIIIEESTIPSIKSGSLHIITYEGGTIGREGKHEILIPDINISKHHLKIIFDKEKNRFIARDLGSRNGTVLNGKRMSSSKQESEPMEVAHGSRIQLGAVTLLCHIHNGNQTCGHCEPGLVQKPEEKIEMPRYNKSKEHKKELLKLKKKFAVKQYNDEEKKASVKYNDRAQVRRDTVGSQNHNEKTEVASIHSNISSENKGFKLLSKMGWSEGQTLGKEGNKGLLEPIPLVSNTGTSGLGSGGMTDSVAKGLTKTSDEKLENYKKMVLKITQERFEKAKTAAVFESDSE